VADLLRAGDRAALDSRWTDALMRYEHVAQQYPDDEGAPEALLAAARIRERILNQKERADALRCDAISRQEQRTPGEAGPAAAAATYRLACAYEEAQRWTDALQAYRRFLAAPASSQGWMLTLARYRVAKLLERVGRREEALDAYRVVVDAEPADEYSARLAARAEERARELSGRTDAGKRTE
jgi:tetratricopeptide (TPR) repeat protein